MHFLFHTNACADKHTFVLQPWSLTYNLQKWFNLLYSHTFTPLWILLILFLLMTFTLFLLHLSVPLFSVYVSLSCCTLYSFSNSLSSLWSIGKSCKSCTSETPPPHLTCAENFQHGSCLLEQVSKNNISQTHILYSLTIFFISFFLHIFWANLCYLLQLLVHVHIHLMDVFVYCSLWTLHFKKLSKNSNLAKPVSKTTRICCVHCGRKLLPDELGQCYQPQI